MYWETVRHLGEVSPDFIPPKRVRWFLSRFRGRGIFAIDSTVIKLALSCIASYPYRSKKAAAKMHTRLPVGSFIPSVVRIEAGRPHDSAMADELTKDMKGGDVLLADRAYVDFAFLHNLTAREVFWVLRQKAIFGAFVQMRNGGWTLSPYSDVDFRYVLDLVFNVLVNEPEMMDVPMTGVWGSNYSGQELKRWTCRLLRHYLIEGNRTMLSSEYGLSYHPGHIADGDFASGAAKWRTKGDVRFDRIKGFGDECEFRGGREELEVGDTFAVLRRKDGIAAEVSQKAVGLIPGRMYLLDLRSFFPGDVRARSQNDRMTGLSVRISGGEIDAVRSRARVFERGARAKKAAQTNWHEIVFVAKSQEADITLSTADSPEGEDIGVNCVGVFVVLD